jgi:hypothetical protein
MRDGVNVFDAASDQFIGVSEGEARDSFNRAQEMERLRMVEEAASRKFLEDLENEDRAGFSWGVEMERRKRMVANDRPQDYDLLFGDAPPGGVNMED